MLRYRGGRLVRVGFIGVVVCVLIVTIGLQPERLMAVATTGQYHAVFDAAGGLAVGNKVKISGVDVGTVTDVGLDGLQALVTFTVERRIRLGSTTGAHIVTGTLLGERVLKVEPAGDGELPILGVI